MHVILHINNTLIVFAAEQQVSAYKMFLSSFVLTALFLTACNGQANDKTIEEELDALLLDLDSGGRHLEQLDVDSKLL